MSGKASIKFNMYEHVHFWIRFPRIKTKMFTMFISLIDFYKAFVTTYKYILQT